MGPYYDPFPCTCTRHTMRADKRFRHVVRTVDATERWAAATLGRGQGSQRAITTTRARLCAAVQHPTSRPARSTCRQSESSRRRFFFLCFSFLCFFCSVGGSVGGGGGGGKQSGVHAQADGVRRRRPPWPCPPRACRRFQPPAPQTHTQAPSSCPPLTASSSRCCCCCACASAGCRWGGRGQKGVCVDTQSRDAPRMHTTCIYTCCSLQQV